LDGQNLIAVNLLCFPDLIFVGRNFPKLAKYQKPLQPSQDIKASEIEQDAHFTAVLASFRYIRCNFTKHVREEQYVYESLSPSTQLYC